MINLKNTLLPFLGGAVSLGLISCGGPSGEPLTSQNIGLVMGNFATVMQSMPTSNNVPSIPIAGVTTLSVGPLAAGCETISPTPLVDLDGDQIAAKKVSTFNCTSQIDGTSSVTRIGTITITDKDETKKGLLGGVRIDFAVPTFDSVEVATGKEYKYSYQGYWDYSANGTGFASKFDFTGYTKYASDTFKNDYTYQYVGEMTVTPSSGTLAWGTSDVNFQFKGTFSLFGDFAAEQNNIRSQKTGSFVVNYYSKDMIYASSGCSKAWRSGSYFLEDSQGTLLEIRYECNSAQLYVNGQASDLFKP